MVDIGFGGGKAEADADAARGGVGVGSHGLEDVAGASVHGGAGAAGTGFDVGELREPFAAKAGMAEHAGSGHTGGFGSLKNDTGKLILDFGFEQAAEVGEVGGAVGLFVGGTLGGHTEAGDGGHVFGAAAEALFLSAAPKEGGEGESASFVEGADAFGAVAFVGGEAGEVDAEGVEVDWNFSEGLGHVAEDEGSGGVGEAHDGVKVLENAGFVVGGHDADEGDGLGQGSVQGVEIEAAAGIDGKFGPFGSGLAAIASGHENGGVFCGGGEKPRAIPEQALHDAEHDGVAGFGGAAGEDEFVGVGVDRPGELSAGGVDGGAGASSGRRGAIARVRVFRAEQVAHAVGDVGQTGGGGVVIGVDHGRFGAGYPRADIWQGAIGRGSGGFGLHRRGSRRIVPDGVGMEPASTRNLS